MTIRVLIADDHGIVRSGLRKLLESEDGIEVVAEAADGAEAIERLAAGARRLVPALADAPIIEHWTGLRPRIAHGLRGRSELVGDRDIRVGADHIDGAVIALQRQTCLTTCSKQRHETKLELQLFSLPLTAGFKARANQPI